MNLNEARDFVKSVSLPEPAARPRMEGLETPVKFGSEPEAVAVAAQVTEFTPRVTPAQRAAVADCLLLAQLAANKATAQSADQMTWYRKYVEVLQNIGWTVDSLSLEEKQFENVDLNVHKAIIPVLAELLGPAVAAASLVISVLKGLQEMDRDKPWITLFERASQHACGAKFQFGFVDATSDGNPSVAIKLLAVAIDAKRTVTQVLFFKFSDQGAKLRTGDSRLAIVSSRLDSIKGPVADRVLPFLSDNISKLDI